MATMTNTQILERIIVSAEKYDGAWAAIEYGPLIISSVGAAALREVGSIITDISQEVSWLAVSCRPSELESWQVAELDASKSRLGESHPCMISPNIGNVMDEIESRDAVDIGFIRPIEAGSDREVFVGRQWKAASMYLRFAELRLPMPHGNTPIAWIVGCTRELTNGEEATANEKLSYAERTVEDRVFHGLGEYRPVANLLASIDDSFQRSLISARSAVGLSEFLDDLAQPISDEEEKIVFGDSEYTARQSDTSESQSLGNERGKLRLAFENCVKDLIGQDAELPRVQLATEGLLKTPYGEWHGWCEVGYGIGGLRSRAIVLAICENRRQIDNAIARLVSKKENSSAKFDLVVIVLGDIADYISELVTDWNVADGLHFANID